MQAAPGVRSMEQEEVRDGDGIVAVTANALHQDGVAVDRHGRIAGRRQNRNMGVEIQGRYVRISPTLTVRCEVDQVLIAEGTVAVGVKVRDDVVTEAVRADKGITVTSTRQSVVPDPTDDHIVAVTTIEGVIASAAVKGVVAGLTGQVVVATNQVDDDV